AMVSTLRLSLLLPARAIGNLGLTFKETWIATRGNTWRIFWGIVASTLPPVLIAQIAVVTSVGLPRIEMFANEAFIGRMTVISTNLMVFYLLVLPIGIGFLSFSYRHFFERA
ncbi:MAG TPA: hypothetical protein VGH49_09360, partial [Xanthobacteraceae bacterium]